MKITPLRIHEKLKNLKITKKNMTLFYKNEKIPVLDLRRVHLHELHIFSCEIGSILIGKHNIKEISITGDTSITHIQPEFFQSGTKYSLGSKFLDSYCKITYCSTILSVVGKSLKISMFFF
jgi:hypothetical protein